MPNKDQTGPKGKGPKTGRLGSINKKVMFKENEVNKDVATLWNAIYSEIYEYKQHKLGEILTIIDAVIVDEKQNKSVKDLIKATIYNGDNMDFRIASWLFWLIDNNDITHNNSRSSVPFRYTDELRNPQLEAYKQ